MVKRKPFFAVRPSKGGAGGVAGLQGMICVCSAENVGVGGLFIQEKEGFPLDPLSKKAAYARIRRPKGAASFHRHVGRARRHSPI